MKSFSAYKMYCEDQFDFSADEYSKFKFGANNIARKFGYDLAEKFIEQLIKDGIDSNRQYIILPSAYSHIPTASFFMKNYLVDKLNHFFSEHGIPPVEEAKIYRTTTYRDDYGKMTAEQRYQLIGRETFYLDKTMLQGKTLIFIDDSKITGTHERIIVKMLDHFDLQNDSYFLYFAEAEAHLDPTVEDYLNYHFVKSLDDLDYIIKNEEFVFNTRLVKYILNSEKQKCFAFLEKQRYLFNLDLYHKAIGNSYHLIKEYQTNLEQLKMMLAISADGLI